MNPNPQYVLSPNLQDYFVDKDTGLPLSSGYVYFYYDDDRNILKPIYTISGSPQNYTFVEIANPVRLGIAGTYIDENGADINVYLYPYNDKGEIELYFVDVLSSGGVPQFDREAWPPFEFADTNIEPDSLLENWASNYIPNGQFLAHTNIPPASPTVQGGLVVNGVTDIAQGGWTFERDDLSAAVDSVTFLRFASYSEFPTSTPRYQVNIQCVTASSATTTFKWLGIKFPNVNKFASNEQNYTFFFAGQSRLGDINASIKIIKFYGTGGSPSGPDQIFQSEVTLTGVYSNFNVTVNFGNNIDKIIGLNDDDYVQIVVSFPVDVTFQVLMTDFALVAGEHILTTFPVTTDADMLDRSLAGFVPPPSYDGSTLHLPIINKLKGWDYDYSQIGKVEYYFTPTIPSGTNLLACDGAGYIRTGYSALGIPYSRLWQALAVSTAYYAGPITGTGTNYFTALYQDSVTTGLRLFNNKAGAQTAATNGTMPGGFTFTTISAGFNGPVVTAYLQNQSGTPTVGMINVVAGFVVAPTAGTSGFTVTYNANYQNNSPIQAEVYVQPTSAAGLAGLYFLFSSPTQGYYVWFKVSGVGADPAVGGRVGILVNVKANFTDIELAAAIVNALNGVTTSNINFAAANTLSGGEYWSFTANSVNYIVWYAIDGAGTQPVGPVGSVYIPISATSATTAAQLRSLTGSLLNAYSVATPSLVGNFLRIADPNLLLDFGPRGSSNVTDYSNVNGVGTYENYLVQGHNHSGTVTVNSYSGAGINPNVIATTNVGTTANPQVFAFNTANAGAGETRTVNISVNAFIRY